MTTNHSALVHGLPMPRLQFRWRKPTKTEQKRSVFGSANLWACDYELILPLNEGDIRRKKGRNYLALKLGGCLRNNSLPDQTDTPLRDGVHANWDSAALGGLPVFVIGSDGVVRKQVGKPREWRYEPVENAA